MTTPIPIRGKIPELEAVNLGDNTRRREWEVFRYALTMMPKYWRIYLVLFCLGLIQLVMDATLPWIGRWAADEMLPKRDWSLFMPLLGPLRSRSFPCAGPAFLPKASSERRTPRACRPMSVAGISATSAACLGCFFNDGPSASTFTARYQIATERPRFCRIRSRAF